MNKKDLAAGVKQMRSVAKLLEQWAEDMEKSVSGSVASAPASASPAVGVSASPAVDASASPGAVPASPPAPAPKLSEIKKYLTEKCAAGYSAQVRAVIASFGVSSLSAVPEEQYGALMEAASGIGGEADAG